MKLKKIGWFILSILVVAGLVLASCGPTEVGEEEEEVAEEEEEMAEEEEEMAEEEEEPSSDEPQYGGTLTIAQQNDITVFDQAAGQTGQAGGEGTITLSHETLIGADWTKGPAGSNEFELQFGYEGIGWWGPEIADSWEIPDVGTFIFHIRDDVYWANSGSEASKLVGGRRMTTDDVVYSIQREMDNPVSSARRNNPKMIDASTITKVDESTVMYTTTYDAWSAFILVLMGAKIVPHEVVEKYGNLNEWENSVGTGPFMLVDFVKGSSARMIKNPNYWDIDPVGPGKGNKLPYLDEVKILIIPDASTRLAALRTAKIEWVENVGWADAASLRETTPDLLYTHVFTAPKLISFRNDKLDLPFHDMRVRRALQMAIDWDALVNDLYGGEAVALSWPTQPTRAYKNTYIPLEDMPESVQELYSHDINKAKQLLADAGYANGFDTNIVLASVPVEDIDLISVIKDMWADINVNLDIQPKDPAVFASIRRSRSHEQISLVPSAFASGRIINYIDIRGQGLFQQSYIDDPDVEEAYWIAQANIFVDWDKIDEVYREMTPKLLEKAWCIPMPTVYNYVFWWPWLKNYQGELRVDQSVDNHQWSKWAWIDQDLKKEVTGR